MGLSARQVLMVLFNSQKDLNSVTGNVDSLQSDKQGVEADQTATDAKLNNQNSEAKLLQEQNQIQTHDLEEYHQLLSETMETEDPMKKTYCGIKEFVIEEASMCGMGMGMGSLQLNSNLKLTGAELLAMDKVLNDNADGALGASCLVDKLHEMGIENAQVSSTGDSIELTRVDENGNETKVQFKDANGDGMLNGCDYDFSDALAKFNEDLQAYTQKVEQLEQQIRVTSKELDMTQEKQEKVDSFIEYLESVKDKQEKTIKVINGEIKANEAEIKELISDISELKSDYNEQLELEEQEEKDLEDEKALQDKETETEDANELDEEEKRKKEELEENP